MSKRGEGVKRNLRKEFRLGTFFYLRWSKNEKSPLSSKPRRSVIPCFGLCPKPMIALLRRRFSIPPSYHFWTAANLKSKGVDMFWRVKIHPKFKTFSLKTLYKKVPNFCKKDLGKNIHFFPVTMPDEKDFQGRVSQNPSFPTSPPADLPHKKWSQKVGSLRLQLHPTLPGDNRRPS